jgi:hypothetical protein
MGNLDAQRDHHRSNPPAWILSVKAQLARAEAADKKALKLISGAAELARGWEEKKKAVEIIDQKLAANPKLTQVRVAEYLGRSTTWLSRALKWRGSGYPEQGPFATEIAARRAAAKIATSQHTPWLADWRTGEVVVDASQEANAVRLLRAVKVAKIFTMAVRKIERKTIEQAWGDWPASGAKRAHVLEKLAACLSDSTTAVSAALKEIETARGSQLPHREET